MLSVIYPVSQWQLVLFEINTFVSYGTCRAYAAFRDPYDNILQCDGETYLVAWHEFEVQ